jgi:hypothetical protein
MLRRRTTVHPDMPSAARAEAAAAPPRFRNRMASFFQKMFIRRPRAIHPVVAHSSAAHLAKIEIANMWIGNPLVNPYTQEVIEVSIHPNSAYVKLYKKVMRELIKELRTHYPPNHILTLEDCKYIKDNLPIIHSIIEITETAYIRYDHLFIRYFIKNMKAYNYDIKYCEDSEIKLHLNIYNSIKTKNPTSLSQSPRASLSQHSPLSPSSRSFAIENYKTIKDLLKDNIDFSKSDISIGKLVANMCVDIKRILYMRNADITLENYRAALHNKKTLEYVNYIYFLKFADIKGISKKIVDYYDKLLLPEHNIDEIKHIYEKIITNMEIRIGTIRENFVCPELIYIYKYIMCLYARHFNQFIDPSIKIEDEYEDEGETSNSGSSGVSGSGGKIKLNPYCPKDMTDLITTEEISDLGDTKRKYVANMILYDTKNKKAFYYCFDTVFLYNYILHSIAVSIKGKNDEEILNEILIDDVADIPKNPFTNVPFTDEELDEICNKVKFLTDKHTLTYNSHIDIKEAIIQRYMKDVRRLLNTRYLKEPNDLTHFESEDWKKTRDLLLNYKNKYDNSYLLLVIDQLKYYEDDNIKNTIKGEYRAYITINFGNLSYLHIINPLVTDNSNKEAYLKDKNNSFLLRLPIFTDEGVKDGKDATVLEFLTKIKKSIENGNYISNDIFPYRKGNKSIIKLEPFYFKRNDDVDGLYKRFIEYASKNDNILQGGAKQKRRRK